MIKKLLIIFIGITCMAIGTGLCNYTQFGIDPFNALCIGVSSYLNISLGMFTFIIQFIIAIFIFIGNKKYIGVGSVIPMVLFGYLLQFVTLLIGHTLPVSMPFFINIIMFIIGIFIIALGMSFYMNCDLGMVPYDGISFTIGDHIHKNPFILRICLDVSVAIAAYFIGGPIQLGSVFIALGIGPILKQMNSMTRRFIK